MSLYEYYRTRSGIVIAPIIVALVIVWFADFDITYRWDAIQHVARAKFYMSSDMVTFFTSSERTSFVYLIWGFMYRLCGESEIITNITNMILGFSGICGLFMIAKEICGKFEAVLAVIVALTLPTLFLVNKWAYLDMPFMSFVIFSVLFLVKYVKTAKNYFLWLSLFFAFLSTGIKVPGIIIFLLIFLAVYGYNLLSKSSMISIVIGSIVGFSLLWIVIQFLSPYIGSHFSIITPLNYGLDAIPLWLSLFNQEILMILCSGLLFLSIVSFFQSHQDNTFYVSIFIAQLISIICLSLFPSKSLYFFPVIPINNYVFYYIPLCLIVGTTLLCLLFKKININWYDVKESGILFLWAGSFILFFMINAVVSGYGVKSIFDVAVLDFRYLIPAFPAIIILFSKGVKSILSSNAHPILKRSCFLIISVIIVTNLIMSFNLTFYYASSGDIHLEGYQKAKSLTENGIIYTHWPFYYFPQGNIMDIGKFDWASANKSPGWIFDNPRNYSPGSAILYNSHFFDSDKVRSINITTIKSRSPYLDPLFPYVSEKNADNVSFGKIMYP